MDSSLLHFLPFSCINHIFLGLLLCGVGLGVLVASSLLSQALPLACVRCAFLRVLWFREGGCVSGLGSVSVLLRADMRLSGRLPVFPARSCSWCGRGYSILCLRQSFLGLLSPSQPCMGYAVLLVPKGLDALCIYTHSKHVRLAVCLFKQGIYTHV